MLSLELVELSPDLLLLSYFLIMNSSMLLLLIILVLKHFSMLILLIIQVFMEPLVLLGGKLESIAGIVSKLFNEKEPLDSLSLNLAVVVLNHL